MHPVLIHVNLNWLHAGWEFNIHTYGLMIALGFLVGMQLAAREARRVDISSKGNYDQFVLDLTFWILIASLAGSRILFIMVEWNNGYAQDPLKIFRIWEGGLVFYGGLLGAIIFSVYYARKKGWSFLFVADTLIPSVSLGQFFGRIGCFAAGCCWGDPVDPDFPLGVRFPAGSLIHSSEVNHHVIDHDAPFTILVHPVQLYESLGNLTLFLLLLLIRTQKRFHGMVLAGYLFLYPFLRYGMETLRGDVARGEDVLGTPFSTSQLISIVLFSIGVAIVIYGRTKGKNTSQRIAPAA
ncbi:MAG: prolipoprotein diacylglyceryl transferase [Myxococcales bacterium]|nr:prolipoprotein diacylglyceryl transferase [Myxococcales bacterium]MCB9648499.1 prolipoprotein diacylglyceryl transferase [Deltaproteobacteria bacterium]